MVSLAPDGSGTSVTIRLRLGFLKPTRGRAQIVALDCWDDSFLLRRQVAYLPGELRLDERMMRRELLHFLIRLRDTTFVADPNQLARQLDVDLSRPLSHLSSGMKRPVALLTVLDPKVDLIILDEPRIPLIP